MPVTASVTCAPPELADLVAGAIRFFEGQRYELRAWVVMPNHAHVVLWPMPGHSLSDILHSWKSFTSHEINKRLPTKVVPFWQSESYEHFSIPPTAQSLGALLKDSTTAAELNALLPANLDKASMQGYD